MSDITIVPKGQSISIKEKAPQLKKLHVGLGWDVNESNGKTFDLDATAVLLDASGKASAVVYYGDLEYKDNGKAVVKHTGDNLTGAGEGDDESIEILLDDVPSSIERIAVIVNIYEAKEKGQHFGDVKSSFVRLVDADTSKEFARHDLASEYAGKTGVLAGEFYREGGEWKFKATAEGVDGSIDEIMKAKGYKQS